MKTKGIIIFFLFKQGGYPNGQANGLKLPLLSNGRIPNGHVSSRDWDRSRDRSVRITENPQVLLKNIFNFFNVVLVLNRFLRIFIFEYYLLEMN